MTQYYEECKYGWLWLSKEEHDAIDGTGCVEYKENIGWLEDVRENI